MARKQKPIVHKVLTSFFSGAKRSNSDSATRQRAKRKAKR